MLLVNVSCWERTRTSYTEGCLYEGCLYVCLSIFLWDWINFSSLPDGLRNFHLEIITPSLRYVMYDLEGKQ